MYTNIYYIKRKYLDNRYLKCNIMNFIIIICLTFTKFNDVGFSNIGFFGDLWIINRVLLDTAGQGRDVPRQTIIKMSLTHCN